MDLTDLLKEKINEGLTLLLNSIVIAIRSLDGTKKSEQEKVGRMVTAMVTALHSLGLTAEMKDFAILVTILLGERRLSAFPEHIVKLMAESKEGAPVPTQVAQVPPKVAVMPPPAPTQPPTTTKTEPTPPVAPEPQRVQKTLEERKNGFLGFMKKIVANTFVDYEKTSGNLGGLLRDGVEFSDTEWVLIFSAIKAVKKGYYLVHKSFAGDFFSAAPAELVDEYIFGQDGEIVQIIIAISEVPEGNRLPGWLLSKIECLFKAIYSLTGLDEFGKRQIESLLKGMEEHDAPQNLYETVASLLVAQEYTPPPPATQKLESVVDAKTAAAMQAMVANRQPAASIEKAREQSAEFLAAAQQAS